MRNLRFRNTNNIPFFVFFTAAFFYVFYPFHYEEGLISADAVFDAQIARNLILGDGLGWQATLQPPFHAIMTAAVYPLFKNILVSGIIISKLMWWFLPLPVYLLAKEMFGIRVALVSAILVFFHPHFGFASRMMEPTVTYPTLLMFGICFLWKAFSRERVFYSFLGGLFFAFAYLSRSEGLFIFLISLSALFIISIKNYSLKPADKSKKLIILAVLIITFIASSLPYILFLRATYGKTVISPKSTYVQIWMKPRIYKDGGGWDYYPSFLYSLSMFSGTEGGDIDLWGLSKNGKLKWQEPKSMGDLINYLMADPGKSFKTYMHNFSKQVPGWIPNNSGQWLYPQVYPLYFVIPAIVWIAFSLWSGTERNKTVFLLFPFAILFILPVFTDGWWKYLLPYSPFLIILAAAGTSHLCEGIQVKRLLSILTITIAVYSLWTVKASLMVKHENKNVAMRIALAKEQKKAGEWAQKRFSGTPNYMTQWSKLAYYLEGRWTAMPVSDYDEMIRYARENNVDYFVFETGSKEESDEIEKVMVGNMPDLEVVDVYESDTSLYGVVFLRIKR